MVDPNPARGMPAALQRYWLAGKGAAKIRWGLPHDFNRCVRNLRKYFPTNPEGLCNILHRKALGAPPGKGHAEAAALLAAMPTLGDIWTGPIAPIGRPTGEPRRMRVFEQGALQHRTLPLPLAWRKVAAEGHMGSVTVGRILGITYGPDHNGQDYAWAWGDWLSEDIVPEVKEARYLVDQGVVGPSVDPGGKVTATVNPENGQEHMLNYTIGGVTLVSIPAFTELVIRTLGEDDDYDDQDMMMTWVEEDGDCGCDGMAAEQPVEHSFAVNATGWKGLPLAMREATFDNDDAVKRIQAWAGVNAQGGDVSKLKRAFLWHDPRLPETNTTSYRLPVGDIINDRLTLVYHAIYAAAALLSGAHGGLPDVPEQDKQELRNVISGIYALMAQEFNDASIRAPWDRSSQEGVQLAMEDDQHAAEAEYAMSDTGYPLAPPKAWFEDPKLPGKTPLTVDEHGRVYGHLAAWGECHRDVTMRECVLAPRSRQEYAPFHLGQVMTAEGDTLKVGKIVMDTRHASIDLGYAAAALHYDNTGSEIAIVRAGEDEHGIWVAGAVVPEATPRKVAKLRRSPLSGDWRRQNGNLELCAALAVNVPAFPVYAMENEEQMALVAAGSVWPDESDEESGEALTLETANVYKVTDDELRDIFAADVDEEQEDRAWELRELLEEDDDDEQVGRAAELSLLFAADGEPAPAQTPSAAPAQPQPTAPAEGGEAGSWEEWYFNAQSDARYSVVEEPEGGGEEETAPAPEATGAAVQPAPAPAAPAPVPAQG